MRHKPSAPPANAKSTSPRNNQAAACTSAMAPLEQALQMLRETTLPPRASDTRRRLADSGKDMSLAACSGKLGARQQAFRLEHAPGRPAERDAEPPAARQTRLLRRFPRRQHRHRVGAGEVVRPILWRHVGDAQARHLRHQLGPHVRGIEQCEWAEPALARHQRPKCLWR
jgi:hypothetical protein